MKKIIKLMIVVLPWIHATAIAQTQVFKNHVDVTSIQDSLKSHGGNFMGFTNIQKKEGQRVNFLHPIVLKDEYVTCVYVPAGTMDNRIFVYTKGDTTLFSFSNDINGSYYNNVFVYYRGDIILINNWTVGIAIDTYWRIHYWTPQNGYKLTDAATPKQKIFKTQTGPSELQKNALKILESMLAAVSEKTIFNNSMEETNIAYSLLKKYIRTDSNTGFIRINKTTEIRQYFPWQLNIEKEITLGKEKVFIIVDVLSGNIIVERYQWLKETFVTKKVETETGYIISYLNNPDFDPNRDIKIEKITGEQKIQLLKEYL